MRAAALRLRLLLAYRMHGVWQKGLRVGVLPQDASLEKMLVRPTENTFYRAVARGTLILCVTSARACADVSSPR